MKACYPSIFCTALLAFSGQAWSAVISQTFESGEDTSAWGSSWTGGAITPGFLDSSIGGVSAGGGASFTQSFSRTFRDNTAGIDVAQPYTISMYVQLDSFDGPDGGLFEIVDGTYGTSNAANLRLVTVAPDEYLWQARSTSGWQSMGITLDLEEPYLVAMMVDPISFTYSASISSVTDTGSILETVTLGNLAFDPGVISSGANGNLLFYLQSNGGGGSTVLVDNINIGSIPEPGIPVMFSTMVFLWIANRSRAAGGTRGSRGAFRKSCSGSVGTRPCLRNIRARTTG